LVRRGVNRKKFLVVLKSSGIRAGVPQGGILSTVMFNVYTSDQPTMPNTLVVDYADDKTIISTSADPVLASAYLQYHLSQMEDWYLHEMAV